MPVTGTIKFLFKKIMFNARQNPEPPIKTEHPAWVRWRAARRVWEQKLDEARDAHREMIDIEEELIAAYEMRRE